MSGSYRYATAEYLRVGDEVHVGLRTYRVRRGYVCWESGAVILELTRPDIVGEVVSDVITVVRFQRGDMVPVGSGKMLASFEDAVAKLPSRQSKPSRWARLRGILG